MFWSKHRNVYILAPSIPPATLLPRDDDESYPYGLGSFLSGRRRRGFLGFFPFDQAIDQMIQEMTEAMENMGNPDDLPQGIPPELIRKRKLPDGTIEQSLGPVIFGYSMTVDEGGKPVIRQFGNVNPNQPSPLKALQEKREPLVDVINEGDTVKIVAELAGVKAEEISIMAEDNGHVIIETTGDRKYRKELQVTAQLNSESGTSAFNNGILEVAFKTTTPLKAKGKKIKVE